MQAGTYSTYCTKGFFMKKKSRTTQLYMYMPSDRQDVGTYSPAAVNTTAPVINRVQSRSSPEFLELLVMKLRDGECGLTCR